MLLKSSLIDMMSNWKKYQKDKKQEKAVVIKTSRQMYSQYLIELLNFLPKCSELFWHCVDVENSDKSVSLHRPLSCLSLLPLISEILHVVLLEHYFALKYMFFGLSAEYSVPYLAESIKNLVCP